MDNEVKQTADFYRLVAWAHARRKQLITVGVSVAVIAAVIGLYTWHKNYNEAQAAEAYGKLKLPMPGETGTSAGADPYIKVADEYSGTMAGARALLTAGVILFDAGKFAEAQRQFEKVLQSYTDFPLADQASVGVAASMEGGGKETEAAARYDEFIRRNPLSSAIPEARSALARIYVSQNKPEKAFEIYNEMLRSSGGQGQDSWTSEAALHAEELVQKYPNLRKPAMPAPSAARSAAAPPKLSTPPPATDAKTSAPPVLSLTPKK